MKIETIVGPQAAGDGALIPARSQRDGTVAVSEVQGRNYEQVYRNNVFAASAINTAQVAYSTAAAQGGPLLWNNSGNFNAVILGIGIGITTASAAAVAFGITGATGQTAAPTTATAIDTGPSSLKIGQGASKMNLYRLGTVAVAGSFFLPLGQIGTGALTVDTDYNGFFDLGGLVICPPGCWVSPAPSAVATTCVAQVSLVWAEVPV